MSDMVERIEGGEGKGIDISDFYRPGTAWFYVGAVGRSHCDNHFLIQFFRRQFPYLIRKSSCPSCALHNKKYSETKECTTRYLDITTEEL